MMIIDRRLSLFGAHIDAWDVSLMTSDQIKAVFQGRMGILHKAHSNNVSRPLLLQNAIDPD
jgi:hypothetical protein